MNQQIETDIQKINEKYLSKKICPVCMSLIKDFLPIPKLYEEKSKQYGFKYKLDDFETLNEYSYSCPKCNASDRDRLYALYIQSQFLGNDKYIEKLNNFDLSKLGIINKIVKKLFPLKNNNEKLKLVDFAPSYPLSKYIKNTNLFDYRSADLYMKSADDKVNIENMQYESESFDCFVCSHVLEHVDDKKALKELYRILKPNGWGILMAPICLSVNEVVENIDDGSEEQRWQYYGQNDHVRLYNKEGYLSRIKEANFKIQEFGLEYFGKDTLNLFGITNKSVLYIVYK